MEKIKVLLDEKEYPKFRNWALEHYNEVFEGTYIQAYLKQRKTKITDW